MNYPIKDFKWLYNTSQLFGVNQSYYRRNFNLPAHQGLDIVWRNKPNHGYGEPIIATHDGVISKLSYESKWKRNGNGIYLLDNSNEFSTVYWHLSEILCTIGQKVKKGDVIGLAGNTGKCFPAPTKDRPYDGTHLHFAVLDYSKQGNDYRGFIDPTPLLAKLGDRLPLYFSRDLYVGRSGDDVSWLQTILKLELGDNVKFEPIGYFGNQTRKAVSELQKKYGVDPTFGYCGRKTRALLMNRWSKFNS